MKNRVITGIFIVGAFLAAYFAFDGTVFSALTLFCLLMALMEIYVILDSMLCTVQPKFCHPHGAFTYEITVLIVAAALCMLMSREELALVICTSMIADVGAFAVGSLIGKHKVKFLAKISAKKSYEGFVGAIVIGGLATYALCWLLKIPLGAATWAYIALGGITAAIGDLLGSASKRQLGVKDSGEILALSRGFRWIEAPMRGHGGYLDRFDSIALSIVVYSLLHFML